MIAVEGWADNLRTVAASKSEHEKNKMDKRRKETLLFLNYEPSEFSFVA